MLLPGGVGRSTLASDSPMPFAVRGESYRLVVDSGRALIDLNNNFTALVHGHAHPAVVEAAQRAVRDGASFGLPNLSELRHAHALMSRLPGLDQVRYTNSGTEAVMTALRVARAHTEREGCIFVDGAYHGMADAALIPGGANAARGVPRGVHQDVVVTPINDAEALVDTVTRQPERFSAVVLDPMPNRAGLVPLTRDFLAAAQRLRDEYGLLLIADEIISFRQGEAGAAAACGIQPDMLTLGKLIGGGHPVGAVVGTAAVMSELDATRPDGLEHGGTFSGNPVTMEAGRVSLELLDDRAIERINDLGERARRALAERVSGMGWEVRGGGSLLRLFPTGPPATVPELQRSLWHEAYERGVLLAPSGLAAISTPMTAAAVDDAVDILCAAVRATI